ncbi:MAG: tetratricopeptide repeat protein [Deltaproteobacteria bacterium]|nr:tetratricopeptide repeat protein [Deltaproteobacteria bacterium]
MRNLMKSLAMLFAVGIAWTLSQSIAFAQEEARVKAHEVKREADKLLKAKEIDRAVEAYKRAIDLWPQYAAAHNGLGKALYKKKDYKGAEQAYATAVAYDMNFAVAHYNLAFVRRKLKKFKESEKEYKIYIKLSPRDPDGYYGLAVSLEKQGKNMEAAKYYREYAKKEKRPTEQKWVKKALKKVAILEKKGDTAQTSITKKPIETGEKMSRTAEPDLSGAASVHDRGVPQKKAAAPQENINKKVIENHTAVAPAGNTSGWDSKKEAMRLKDAGDRFRKAGQVEKAKEKYMAAIKLWPGYASAHNELGLLYYKENELEQAKKEYEIAVNSDSNYALGYFNLGFIMKKTGDLEKAEKAYRRYTQLKPSEPDGFFGLASVLEKENKRAEAASMYKRYAQLEKRPAAKKWVELALKKARSLGGEGQSTGGTATIVSEPSENKPDRNRSRSLLAMLDPKLGSERLEDPRSPFVRIPEPENERIKVSRGIEAEADTAFSGGDLSHAVLAYRDSLAKHEANLSSRFKLAAVYAKQGRMTMAVRQLAKLLDIDPAHPQARKALEAMKEDPAVSSAAGAVLEKAGRVSSLLSRASDYCSLGKYAEAIPMLSNALEIDRKCILCQVELGTAYAGQGKFAMAAVQYTKALSFMPGIKSAIYGLAQVEAKAGHKVRAKKLFELYIRLEKDPAMKDRINAARQALQSL